MKYNTQASYNYQKQKYTKPSGKSMTIPDQNYTVRQILEKFTSGQPINNTGTYNNFDLPRGEKFNREDFNNFQKDAHQMDLTEQKAAIKNAQAEITRIRTPKKQENANQTQQPQPAPANQE